MGDLANAPDQLLSWAAMLFIGVLKVAFALLMLRAALDAIAGGLRGLFRRPKRRTRRNR